MIECGWCGAATVPDRCGACDHRDPAAPWLHRDMTPPIIASASGRPVLDEHAIRRRYAEARAALSASGVTPTVEAIAEQLDRSPRTVREWRKRYGLH